MAALKKKKKTAKKNASPQKTKRAVPSHPRDIKITAKVVRDHGLSKTEYGYIKKILEREPSYTELGIFSVMWSEHCSYKTSKPVLKGFPTTGKQVLQGPGENAGVVDIGGGMAACFKIESHNHPSAIEPYQGAATGVGGILRDIFTMGARPIANMNSLRFGNPSDLHVRHLLNGVVEGIAGYGNCMGIPTVAGEVVFDDTYRDNCLVNAFALGVMPHEDLVKGTAKGEGNPVMYIGSTTGRDGIHGATFASADLDGDNAEKRSAVQVADPFMEKLLLEATLELIRSGHLVGIQDMGAAGLTSSSVEMAFRGGAGIEIDTAKVPQRETAMVPYEICLSESQERMLLVAKKGREKFVEAILKKWNLHATVIGQVTSDGHHRVLENGRVVSDIPVAPLADDQHPFFPKVKRPQHRPKYLDHAQKLELKELHQPHDMGETLLRLLASPTIAHKGWIFKQYDHMVRTNTLQLPGSDAAVIRVKENGNALAMSVDGNGRYCFLDPYTGGKIAVAEAARNVAVSGAVPLACTDCLNFGNPEDPEIMWQLAEAVRGMAEACRELGVPVIGGNVSLYNQSPQGAIDPTPVVAVVGLLKPTGKGKNKGLKPVGQAFKRAGDIIYVAGKDLEELGASEYLAVIHQRKAGKPPKMDLHLEKRVHELCAEAASAQLLSSAHDLSDGGLAVALAESCLNEVQALGCEVHLPQPKRWDAALFGESQSRVLFSCSPQNAESLEKLAAKHRVALLEIGETGGRRLVIEHSPVNMDQILNLGLDEMQAAFKGAFTMMEGSHAN